jgi:hypothetical protein
VVIDAQCKHVMIFGEGGNEIFGHPAEARLYANVSAVEDSCH